MQNVVGIGACFGSFLSGAARSFEIVVSAEGEEGAVRGGSNQGVFPAFQKHTIAIEHREVAVGANGKATEEKRDETRTH
jgi:hypothetical protein